MEGVCGMFERRAELYDALAEALAELPPWLMLPGREWPLTQAAARLAPHSAAVEAMAHIPAEAEAIRRARHTRLFGGPGRPRFWLYESMWRSGCFLGPEAISLEQLYKEAGLRVAGAELPDHASVELAFLAHLAERQAAEPEYALVWQKLERSFIKKHAGQWLPALGRSLAASADEVYGPIGALMADFLLEKSHPHRQNLKLARISCLPLIMQQELCSLCGFCVQVCPTRALTINETPHDTILMLSISACNGCRKCKTICPSGAIAMNGADDGYLAFEAQTALRHSPRVFCPGCGEATVSRAEIDFVAEKIGRPGWLTYCLPCRSELMEKQQ
jgi:TorA maturation chaperone TorD/Fe-S-cluster-containing hydrogenase component 2